MNAQRLSLQAVQADDFEAMLALRVAALRPSLERLGRFDAQRARERLVATFMPHHMRHIVRDGVDRIGYLTLWTEAHGQLRLEHLYLRPDAQGQGVGAWALAWAMDQARQADCTLRVSALKGSDANRFYQFHGFEPDGEGEWDLHHRWSPAGATA
jgi:GNAT superfamily N-acetyltransferase